MIPSIYQNSNCTVLNENEIQFEYNESYDIHTNDTVKCYIENYNKSLVGNVTNIDTNASTFTLTLDESIDGEFDNVT